MVIRIEYGGTASSAFNHPVGGGLMGREIEKETEGQRKGNRMKFVVTLSYKIEEVYTNTITTVFQSQSVYELVTDGSLTPQDLYQAYQHAEMGFLSQLGEAHKNASIPSLIKLDRLSFEALEEELNFHVQNFRSGK